MDILASELVFVGLYCLVSVSSLYIQSVGDCVYLFFLACSADVFTENFYQC